MSFGGKLLVGGCWYSWTWRHLIRIRNEARRNSFRHQLFPSKLDWFCIQYSLWSYFNHLFAKPKRGLFCFLSTQSTFRFVYLFPAFLDIVHFRLGAVAHISGDLKSLWMRRRQRTVALCKCWRRMKSTTKAQVRLAFHTPLSSAEFRAQTMARSHCRISTSMPSPIR